MKQLSSPAKKRQQEIRERSILEVVEGYSETGAVVALTDVLTEAGRLDISRDAAEDIMKHCVEMAD